MSSCVDRRCFLAAGLPLALVASAARAAEVPAPTGAPSEKPPLFPTDAQFWYETLRNFGAAEYGGALFNEVLVTSGKIAPGDYDGWYDAWNAIADRVASEGDAQLHAGRNVSARDSYLRASNYYRSSEFFLHANRTDPRVTRAYLRAVDCYKAAAALWRTPIIPVEIPYEGTTLPGYLHQAEGGAPRPRPLLIIHTGFDGSAEENHWGNGARAAAERGYHVLSFDGPGQFGPIHRQGLVFRPDWEKVVAPVVDFCLKQPDVDSRRIALMGISMGGELAPRAAAYERRLAALICNDGVYDYGAAMFAGFPPEKRVQVLAAIKEGPSPAVDRAMEAIMRANPVARWTFTQGMYSFGADTPSAYLRATLAYTLAGGVAEGIRCPTLVCEAQDDLFFKGQAQELFDHLTCPKTFMTFTGAEGAGAHCELGASRYAYARIYDWLDDILKA